MFITFEGLEGSGKTTQIALLSKKLSEDHFFVVTTREPGGTRIGELIRNITHDKKNKELTSESEACLMAASRSQLVKEIIKPALADKKIVLCDRFIDSSLSYQGYGRGLGENVIWEINKYALDDCLPDLTFLLDLPLDDALDRRRKTGKIDRLDLEDKSFYEKVQDGYKILSRKYKDRYCIIDSSKSIEEVSEEIYKQAKSRLV